MFVLDSNMLADLRSPTNISTYLGQTKVKEEDNKNLCSANNFEKETVILFLEKQT